MTLAAKLKPSENWALVSLLIANVVPLFGVYLWGWKLADLLMLYWLESAVIGAFTVVRMVSMRSEDSDPLAQIGMKLFSVPFFIVHYGIFWLVHGLFLIMLFAGGTAAPTTGRDGFLLAPIGYSFTRADVFAWPVAAMVASHGVAFVTGFLATGKYRTNEIRREMMRPYSRVLVLHFTIVGGAFLVLFVGQSLLVLLLFVLLKMAVDVYALRRETRKAVSTT